MSEPDKELEEAKQYIQKHSKCQKSCKYLDQECQNILEEKYHTECVQFKREAAKALTTLDKRTDDNATDDFIQNIRWLLE